MYMHMYMYMYMYAQSRCMPVYTDTAYDSRGQITASDGGGGRGSLRLGSDLLCDHLWEPTGDVYTGLVLLIWSL